MAGIDKTYIHSYEEYEELKEWCEGKSFTLSNGDVIRPSDYLYKYGSDFKEECDKHKNNSDWYFPVWNTPQFFDMWLYKNCPIKFVQDRLREQYPRIEKEYESYLPQPRPKASDKFKIISKPKFHHKRKVYSDKYHIRYEYNWWVSITEEDDWPLDYNEKHDAWYYSKEQLPWSSSVCHIRNFNIKKLLRKIKKWKLGKGCVITASGIFVGQEYKIIMK